MTQNRLFEGFMYQTSVRYKLYTYLLGMICLILSSLVRPYVFTKYCIIVMLEKCISGAIDFLDQYWYQGDFETWADSLTHSQLPIDAHKN